MLIQKVTPETTSCCSNYDMVYQFLQENATSAVENRILLKIKILKVLFFLLSSQKYKENPSAVNSNKKSVYFKFKSIYLMQRPFLVYDLPPIMFKGFSTTIHYSVMMTLTFIINFKSKSYKIRKNKSVIMLHYWAPYP